MSEFYDSASEASSHNDYDYCPFHDDPREGICNGETRANKPCIYRASVAEEGYLPVCGKHNFNRPGYEYYWYKNNKESMRAGRCQATEECGHICNRLSRHLPPYHLCSKHQEGSDSLPCHLLRLPCELRLMVYRHLFPQVFHARLSPRVNAAILKTNRQLSQEASAVLYDESIFKVSINARRIEFRGSAWDYVPFSKNKANKYSVEALLGSGANYIRHLEIDVTIGNQLRRSRTISRGITWEDHELYLARDNVRKFTKVLGFGSNGIRLSPLKRLTVQPIINLDFHWGHHEATVAQFLTIEPLQMIRSETVSIKTPSVVQRWGGGNNAGGQFAAQMQATKSYSPLLDNWLNAIKISPDMDFTGGTHEPSGHVQRAHRKIENFAQLFEIQHMSSTKIWASTLFTHLERPLHLARLAYENDDGDMMDKIRKAVMVRWVNGVRQQQESLRAMAESINDMFETDGEDGDDGDGEDEDGAPTPRELYPDAFEFEDTEPLKDPDASHQAGQWSELDADDPAPKLGRVGVTVKKDSNPLRIRICKDGEEWSRLKTPAMVRQLRALK